MSLINIISYSLIMVIGPQLLVPITLILNKNVKKVSTTYIFGTLISTLFTSFLFVLLFNIFGKDINSLFTYQGNGTIKIALIIGLIILIIKTFIKRKDDTKSKFIEIAINGDIKTVFIVAFVLFSIFPTDLMVNISMAKSVSIDQVNFLQSVLPLALLNTFFVSIPYLFYLVFREKVIEKVPKVRANLEQNVWIINIFLYSLFIYLLLS